MSIEHAMAKRFVTYERKGFVGFLTLNRAEKRNAVSLAVWEALDEAVAMAEADAEVRAIVVRGEGKSFCSGLDLSPDNEIITIITGKPDAAQKMRFYRAVRRVQRAYSRLEHLPVPTIAAIHSHCLGAGLELALCCDIRLCSADAIFALPEAALAIITDVGGLQRLPRVVGQGHAREIAYRGFSFDAERARTINLVNEVYPDKDTLDTRALEMALEIAANPPLAVQGAKDVFLYNDNVPLERAQDYTAARSAMIMPSDDLVEAMTAFLQKRKGEFKGS